MFYIIWGIFSAIIYLVLKRQGDKNALSKVMLILILLSILTNISLAQNYTQSLIPEANDGIGISNILASWTLPDDRWSIAMFKSYYDKSIIVTLVLLITYALVIIKEVKNSKQG